MEDDFNNTTNNALNSMSEIQDDKRSGFVNVKKQSIFPTIKGAF